MPGPPPTSVLATILTFDDPHALDGCLDAIAAQDRPPDEVLVVDNGGRPAHPVVAHRTTGPPIRVVRTERNLGPAGGHALALGHLAGSAHDWAWVMDDDVRPDREALTSLLAVAEARGRTLIEPRVRDADTGDEVRRHGWWGVLVPAEIVAEVGLPNAELFWWTEDTEYLQWRIPRAGHRPARTDELVVSVSLRRASAAKPAWKYFYESRNQVFHRLHVQGPDRGEAAMRHLTRRVRWWRAARAVSRLSVRAVVREREHRLGKLAMVWRGAIDGVRGRLGITVEPDVSHRPDAGVGPAGAR